MLIRKGGQWHLYPHKVRYTNSQSENETNVTAWASPSKKWWIEMESKHKHITVHEFTEVDLTEEQIARFEEIKDMPEDFSDLYEKYILTGDTSNDFELSMNHPFNIILLNQTSKLNGDYLIDFDFRLMMVELGL